MSGTRKDIMRLLEQARAQGFAVCRAGSGHWKIVSPAGSVVIAAFSPSSGYALQRIRRDLKRAGFKEG